MVSKFKIDNSKLKIAPLVVHTFTLPGPGLFRNAVWTAEFSARGLRALKVREAGQAVPARSSGADKRLAELKALLRERLAGRDANLPFEACDLDDAPDFHLRVWKAMQRIPFGEVLTYGEVAMDAGSPLASRACGQACGSNRIILLIPCHRVVSSAGLGGFGCGLHWKKALLALEGYPAATTKQPAPHRRGSGFQALGAQASH